MCQLGFKKKKTRLSSFQSHTGILGGIDMDWVLVISIGHIMCRTWPIDLSPWAWTGVKGPKLEVGGPGSRVLVVSYHSKSNKIIATLRNSSGMSETGIYIHL